MNKILSVVCSVGLFGGLGLFASSSGCKDDLDDDGPGAGTEGDECIDCPQGENAYLCGPVGGGNPWQACATPSVGCAACGSPAVCGGRLACDGLEAETDDAWDPSLGITQLSNNSYSIDEDLWNSLLTNPFQLLHDGARVVPQNPYYEFSDVSNDDFFYELGFRTGDTIRKVNGARVSTDTEAADVYFDVIEDTEFEIEIGRGQSTITLDFVIE